MYNQTVLASKSTGPRKQKSELIWKENDGVPIEEGRLELGTGGFE